MIYTTDNLLTSIKNRAQLPDTTNPSSISAPANLLSLATEEMRIKIVPLILNADKEFYVSRLDVPVVANQEAYALPTRAAGNVLRSIRLVNGAYDAPFGAMDRDSLPMLPASTPLGYFFEDNKICLFPAPASAGLTIRMRYFQRPSRLEQTANCAQVTAVNTVASQVTVSSVPASWQAGNTVDFIAQVVPYPTRAIDQAIVSISGTTITFSTLPSDLAVSDWIALSEYSPLPQMPEEFQPVLSQMVVCKCLEATGDRQGLQVALADLKVNLANAVTLITPRDESHPDKIVGTNWRRLTSVRGFLR